MSKVVVDDTVKNTEVNLSRINFETDTHFAFKQKGTGVLHILKWVHFKGTQHYFFAPLFLNHSSLYYTQDIIIDCIKKAISEGEKVVYLYGKSELLAFINESEVGLNESPK